MQKKIFKTYFLPKDGLERKGLDKVDQPLTTFSTLTDLWPWPKVSFESEIFYEMGKIMGKNVSRGKSFSQNKLCFPWIKVGS